MSNLVNITSGLVGDAKDKVSEDVSAVRNTTANVVDAVRGFDRQVLDFLAAGLRTPVTAVENVFGNVTAGISREVSRATR